MIDTNKIQSDFSIFENYKKENGKDLVYLDSASSSLTPNSVLSKMNEYYTQYRSNIERSSFGLSVRAYNEFENTRSLVAKLIGASRENIVFTSGATDSANKLVDMILTANADQPLRIATSLREHHSVLVTLRVKSKKQNVEIQYIEPNDNGTFSLNKLKELMDSFKPEFVFIQAANNVTGEIIDVHSCADIIHKCGGRLVCDASQMVGHTPFEVRDIDAVFFSAHKMCGPTGVGVLYCSTGLLPELSPATFGGGGVVSVSGTEVKFAEGTKRFEPGTQNIAGVIGFGAALSYLEEIGIDNIHTHTKELVEYATGKLSTIPRIHIFAAESNSGVLAFYIEHIHTHDIESLLAVKGIAVRAGLHCAELFVKSISDKPLTRASFYIYNTKADVDSLYDELMGICTLFT